MKQLKRFVALALSGAMLLPTIALAAGNEDGGSEIVYSDTTVTCDGITFQREQEGVYAGLPCLTQTRNIWTPTWMCTWITSVWTAWCASPWKSATTIP
ncbi:MAG: hypothetical protein ACI4KC_03195 [Gemmiger sp.]